MAKKHARSVHHKETPVRHADAHPVEARIAEKAKKPFLLTPLGMTAIILVLAFAGIFAYFAIPHGPAAAAGDTVSVDYVGRYQNGTVFDTSLESVAKSSGIFASARTYEPLSFKLGSGAVIPGFDKAVAGMRVGQKETVTIRPEDAYGYPQPSLIENATIPLYAYVPYDFVVSKGINQTIGSVTNFLYGPAELADMNSTTATFRFNPQIGHVVDFGNGMQAVITAVYPQGSEFVTTLDGNPPLAGQVLVFDMTLKGITKPSA